MTYVEQVRRLVLARMLLRLETGWSGTADLTWLADCRAELAASQPAGLTAQQAADWWAATAQEPGDRGALGGLPLSSALLLVAAGLIESDVRFGSLFAALQEPMRARRPCIGLLGWLLAAPDITAADLTAQCHDLIRHGLLSVENPTDPRSEWVLRVPVPVWDLLATGTLDPGSLPSQLRLRPREEFPSLDDLALSADVTGLVARLPDLVTEDLTAIVVRGMSRSGRTTVLGSVAALAGDDVLVYDGDTADPAWQLFGALASIADVLPVVVCEPGPGDTVKLPRCPGCTARSASWPVGRAASPVRCSTTLSSYASATAVPTTAACSGALAASRATPPTSTWSSNASCSPPATSVARRRSLLSAPGPTGVIASPSTTYRPPPGRCGGRSWRPSRRHWIPCPSRLPRS